MKPYLSKKILVTLIVMPVTFLAAMTVSLLIPNSLIKDNVVVSQNIIASEGMYHDAYHTPQVNWLAGSDGYSDNIFLEQQIASRDNGLLHDAAMPSYARYWHGYSIFLRPLLVFFDLSQIRQILVIAFTVLLTLLTYLIIRHIGMFVGISFALAIALVNPPVIMISLQYSNMFLLTLSLSIILLLLMVKRVPKNTLFLFFTIAGGLTSFFDLLTTPSITLGIPLILYIAFRIKTGDTQKILKDIFVAGLLWGAGYLFVWLSKWVIASLIFGVNIFQEATDKVAFWSSDTSSIQPGELGVIAVLTEWLKRIILFWPLAIGGILYLIFIAIERFKKGLKLSISKESVHVLIALLIAILIPIAWIILARQHSFNHQWFSYRHLIVSIFGTCVLLWYLTPQISTLNYSRSIQKVKALKATLFNKIRRIFIYEK